MNLIDKLFRREDLGLDICPPYLIRRTLFRLPFGIACYLHHYVGDDWSLDLHDHPKRFISIGLWGSYIEEFVLPHDASFNIYRIQQFKAPWIRTFPAEHRHRLVLQHNPITGNIIECWTLCIVGPTVRKWGFWHAGRWIYWQDYITNKELVQKVKSC